MMKSLEKSIKIFINLIIEYLFFIYKVSLYFRIKKFIDFI